jgi:hypothetical protein
MLCAVFPVVVLFVGGGMGNMFPFLATQSWKRWLALATIVGILSGHFLTVLSLAWDS